MQFFFLHVFIASESLVEVNSLLHISLQISKVCLPLPVCQQCGYFQMSYSNGAKVELQMIRVCTIVMYLYLLGLVNMIMLATVLTLHVSFP